MHFLIKDYLTHISLGVYPIEKKIKNKVLATIEFDYNVDRAKINDQLDDTIDYDKIINILNQVVELKHFNLIEHFLYLLHQEILKLDNKISNLKISLKKLSAINDAEFVQITYNGS